jgi:hypothetical protein
MRAGLRALAMGLGLALVACGDTASAPPPPPMGAPVAQEPPPTPFPEAPLTEDNRAQLGAVVAGFLIGSQERWGDGMIAAAGLADIIVPLQPGTDYRASIALQGGRPYRFVGACDYECRNIDLELWDANGVVVARDLMLNDTPVMDYTPAAGGAFTLRILMQTCTITPCYAGARILTVQ